MEFRWVAFIAVWTLVSGPMMGGPTGRPATSAISAVSGKPDKSGKPNIKQSSARAKTTNARSTIPR